MTIPQVDAILLDTNVLLAATTPSRGSHNKAVEVLNLWPNRGITLALSGQVLREYLVVATRPLKSNGLGLKLEDALVNCQAFSARCRMLNETGAVSIRLRELARETQTSGKQLHDANLVATALVHEVTAILTQNLEDFQRFSKRVRIVEL